MLNSGWRGPVLSGVFDWRRALHVPAALLETQLNDTEYVADRDNIQVNVQGGGSGMGIRSVSQGIADIGTSSKELSAEDSVGVETVELGKEGIVIGVHNSNTINDLSTDQINQIFSGEITNWKELGGPDEEIHVVTREEGSGTRKEAEEQLKAAGIPAEKLDVIASIGNQETIKKSVRQGMGITILSELAAVDEEADGELLTFPIPGADAGRDINLVYNKNYQLSRSAERFIKVVKEVYLQESVN